MTVVWDKPGLKYSNFQNTNFTAAWQQANGEFKI